MKTIKFIAVLAQPVLLLLMLAYAYAPIYLGTDVVIRTRGYDPRDFFRGNYVDLRYDFSDININSSRDENSTFFKIYAVLELGDDGVYRTKEIVQKRPQDGVYIEGIHSYYSKKFGIESYFMPKDKALKLERDLRDDEFEAFAHLKIYNGDARLIDIKLVPLTPEQKTKRETQAEQ